MGLLLIGLSRLRVFKQAQPESLDVHQTSCCSVQRLTNELLQGFTMFVYSFYVWYLGRNQFAMAVHEPVSVQDHSNKHYVF